MAPFGSNDSVTFSNNEIYLNHAMNSRLVFDSHKITDQNLNQIQLNNSDSKLRTISDYTGDKFIAKNVHSWDEDQHYLVLDAKSRLWHFHFIGNELLQRTCVQP